MIEIHQIQTKNKKIFQEISHLHILAFKGFFLTFLGEKFLAVMYECYFEHNQSGLLIATDNDNILGFLAYSFDFSGLYKFMIKKKVLFFFFCCFKAIFKNPKCLFRLLRSFLKPQETKREEKYVQLSSIGVDPLYKNKGIGSSLIDFLKNITDFSKYSYINLETDALNNDGVNSFYIRNGFKLVRVYKTYEGREMNEYRFEK